MATDGKKTLTEIYRERYLAEGDSPKGFFWNNQETQDLRFHRILQMIPKGSTEKVSLHDIGCGTGSFKTLATEKWSDLAYSGCEVVPEMVNDFKANHPQETIHQGSFLELDYGDQTFNFVTLSGLFNMPGEDTKDWPQFCKNTLKKMWDLSTDGIVFNGLTQYSTFTDESLHYIDPKEIFDFCHTQFSRHISLDHAYPLYEFTMGVWKPEAIQSLFPETAFSKYFKNS